MSTEASTKHTPGPRVTLPPFPRDYEMVLRATNECAQQNRRMSSLYCRPVAKATGSAS